MGKNERYSRVSNLCNKDNNEFEYHYACILKSKNSENSRKTNINN